VEPAAGNHEHDHQYRDVAPAEMRVGVVYAARHISAVLKGMSHGVSASVAARFKSRHSDAALQLFNRASTDSHSICLVRRRLANPDQYDRVGGSGHEVPSCLQARRKQA
jgi:hypothetical protein